MRNKYHVGVLCLCISSYCSLAWESSYANEEDTLLPPIIQSNSVPATIISLQDSWISAEIAANIDRIRVDVGDNVKKGDLLAQLDCREYTIQKSQTEADINSLNANLPGIQARIEAAKNDVEANKESISLYNIKAKAAQASVSAAQADANRIKAQSLADKAKCHLARLDLNRARDLGKRQVISQQEVDQAVMTFKATQAACNATQPELESANAKSQSLQASASAAKFATKVQQAKTSIAQSNIKVQEAELHSLHAQISAAETKLQTDSLMVSRCSLESPFDGEIVERLVQLGQRIGIGEKAFRLISVEQSEVSASISETELQAIQSAKSIYFSTPDKKVPINYRAAIGMLNGEARTREVRFTFSEENSLAIGTSGRVVWEGNKNDM